MSRKRGDMQHAPPKRPALLIEELAHSLTNSRDVRFKRFWNYEPAPIMCRWLASSKRINCMVGATRSMKTSMGIVKAIAVYTGIVPPGIRAHWKKNIPTDRPRHVRIIIANYTKVWPETIEPYLIDDEKYGFLPKQWAADYDPQSHMYHGPDGSWLSITAVDPEHEAGEPTSLRSADVDYTYIDEETTEYALKESLSRSATLADGPQEVDLGWCPQSGREHWQVKDLYGLGYDLQTHERRPESEQSPEHNIIRIEMRDNPSITPETIDAFTRTLKPWEYDYRVRGIPTNRATDPFFDLEILHHWETSRDWPDGILATLEHTDIDREDGTFESVMRIVTREDAADLVWHIWEMPRDGERYIAINDAAEGKPKSDYQVNGIWRATHEGAKCQPVQVAQCVKRVIPPDTFAIDGLCMATIYGECLFVWEVNNTAGGIVTEVCRNYGNLYTRGSRTREELPEHPDLLGWHTDWQNKPTACQEAYRMIGEWQVQGDYCGIRSRETLRHMMDFEDKVEKDRNGFSRRVLGAKKGSNDDCVTELWIASYVIRLQFELLTISEISATHPDQQYESMLEREAERRNSMKAQGRMTGAKPQPSMRKIAGRSAALRHPDPIADRYKAIYGSR